MLLSNLLLRNAPTDPAHRLLAHQSTSMVISLHMQFSCWKEHCNRFQEIERKASMKNFKNKEKNPGWNFLELEAETRVSKQPTFVLQVPRGFHLFPPNVSSTPWPSYLCSSEQPKYQTVTLIKGAWDNKHTTEKHGLLTNISLMEVFQIKTEKNYLSSRAPIFPRNLIFCIWPRLSRK